MIDYDPSEHDECCESWYVEIAHAYSPCGCADRRVATQETPMIKPAEESSHAVGVFEPGPTAEEFTTPTGGRGYLIRPDPNAGPAQWSPFNDDAGFARLGALREDQ